MVWLDVEITYHNSVYNCKVNNQSKVSNSGLSVTTYMIDCYRQHLQDDAQAQADQEEQQTTQTDGQAGERCVGADYRVSVAGSTIPMGTDIVTNVDILVPITAVSFMDAVTV